METYRELARAVETLNLVHSVSNVVQKLVEPFFRYHFFSCVEDQHRIGRDIVVDLRRTELVRRGVQARSIIKILTSMAMMFFRSKSTADRRIRQVR